MLSGLAKAGRHWLWSRATTSSTRYLTLCVCLCSQSYFGSVVSSDPVSVMAHHMCSASISLWFPFLRPPQILHRSKESLTLVFLELFSTGCPIGFTQVCGRRVLNILWKRSCEVKSHLCAMSFVCSHFKLGGLQISQLCSTFQKSFITIIMTLSAEKFSKQILDLVKAIN